MNRSAESSQRAHGHWWHMALCGVLIAAGVVVAIGGIGGAWLPAFLIVGCVAMMGAMMWLMMGAGRSGGH